MASGHILGSFPNTVATLSGGAEVVLCGDVAYVTGVNGLAAYQCSGSPMLLGQTSIGVATVSAGATVAAALSAKTIFVVGVRGVEAFDVSNPAQLQKVAEAKNEVATISAGGHVAVSNAIYIGGVNGIVAHDVKTLQKLSSLKNEVGTISAGTTVAAAGNRLCAAGVKGIAVYDSSDPCNPRLLGKVANECGTLSAGVDIALDPTGTKLLAAGARAVALYDVSSETGPALLGKLPHKVATMEGGAHVALSGARGYVAGSRGIAAYEWRQGVLEEICITGQNVGTMSAGVALAADDKHLIAVGIRGVAVITSDTSKWPPRPEPECCLIL